MVVSYSLQARQDVVRLIDELAESQRQADTYRDKAEQVSQGDDWASLGIGFVSLLVL